ncbi:MAG: hypothetical protein U0T73_13005 [Chitinophagales bacterium]
MKKIVFLSSCILFCSVAFCSSKVLLPFKPDPKVLEELLAPKRSNKCTVTYHGDSNSEMCQRGGSSCTVTIIIDCNHTPWIQNMPKDVPVFKDLNENAALGFIDAKENPSGKTRHVDAFKAIDSEKLLLIFPEQEAPLSEEEMAYVLYYYVVKID